jgi:hypothetical protein
LGWTAESRRVNITAKTPNPLAINYFANCATFSVALRLSNQYDEFQGENTMTIAQSKAIGAIKAIGGKFTQTGITGDSRKVIVINGTTVYGSTLGALVDASVLFHSFSVKMDGNYINTWSLTTERLLGN